MRTSEQDEFDEFMASRWPRLVRLAYGLTGDRWAAEDIAQTALANAYAAWRRVRRADDIDAYLRRMVVNASNRAFRKRRFTERPAAGAGREPASPDAQDPAVLVGDRFVLLAALAELPPRQRAVIVLRYWEDLSDAQTATLLGCSASTVRSQAARALAKLRASALLADAERVDPPQPARERPGLPPGPPTRPQPPEETRR